MSESNQTVEVLQRQVADLTARCAELQGALSEMETLHDELEQSSKMVEQELEETIKELEETNARQAEQLREMERDLERSEREKRDKQSAAEQMKRVADEERERGVVARREASTQIDELKESVARLSRDHEAVKTQLVSVEQENERLERVERTLSDEVKRGREVHDKQVEEITYLHTERDELTDLLQRARDEIKDLKAELMARDLVSNSKTESGGSAAVVVQGGEHVIAHQSPRSTPRTVLSVQSVALVDEMLALVHTMELRLHGAGDGS
jgi:chromosome segregation ATPase